MIETKGYTGGVEATDAMAKAANVTINKMIPIGGGLITVVCRGDVASVNFEADIPCTTVCYVDAANGSNSFGGDTPATAKKTIQAAINQVNAGGQVRVLPGKNYARKI